MIFTFDSEFDEALASPEALERQLVKLTKQRRLGLILHGLSGLVFLLCFFAMVWASCKSPSIGLGVISGGAMLMLFVSIHQLGWALSAQADIRALMAFKKLREMQSSS